MKSKLIYFIAVCTPRENEEDTYNIGHSQTITGEGAVKNSNNDDINTTAATKSGNDSTAAGDSKVRLKKMISEDPSDAWYDVPQEMNNSVRRQMTSSMAGSLDIEQVIKHIIGQYNRLTCSLSYTSDFGVIRSATIVSSVIK